MKTGLHLMQLQPVAQTSLLLIKFNLSHVFINDEFKTTKKNIVLLIKRPFIKPNLILLIKKIIYKAKNILIIKKLMK